MKAETRRMLEVVDKAHDWLQGQVRAGKGTELSSTDICQACSLRRHYFSDRQNGIQGSYRFSHGETDFSLRQAVLRGCSA